MSGAPTYSGADKRRKSAREDAAFFISIDTDPFLLSASHITSSRGERRGRRRFTLTPYSNMRYEIIIPLSILLFLSFFSLALCKIDGPAAPVSAPHVQIVQDSALKRQAKAPLPPPPPPQAAPFPILKKKDPLNQRFLQSVNGKVGKKLKIPIETGMVKKELQENKTSIKSGSVQQEDQIVMAKQAKGTVTQKDRSSRTEL